MDIRFVTVHVLSFNGRIQSFQLTDSKIPSWPYSLLSHGLVTMEERVSWSMRSFRAIASFSHSFNVHVNGFIEKFESHIFGNISWCEMATLFHSAFRSHTCIKHAPSNIVLERHVSHLHTDLLIGVDSKHPARNTIIATPSAISYSSYVPNGLGGRHLKDLLTMSGAKRTVGWRNRIQRCV